jgi:hypothetical protein
MDFREKRLTRSNLHIFRHGFRHRHVRRHDCADDFASVELTYDLRACDRAVVVEVSHKCAGAFFACGFARCDDVVDHAWALVVENALGAERAAVLEVECARRRDYGVAGEMRHLDRAAAYDGGAAPDDDDFAVGGCTAFDGGEREGHGLFVEHGPSCG